MRAYLIDTPNKQVLEVDYDGGYKSISKLIKADLYTVVRINDHDSVFVDDEGLINGNPHGWFTINGYPQPLRGYGLVLGCNDEGDLASPLVSGGVLSAVIDFPEDSELDDPESYAKIEVQGFDTAEAFFEALGLKESE